MTFSPRRLAALAMLAMTICISNPALAQEKQPSGGSQPSPSAPGPNGNQVANPPASSGAGAGNQANNQSTSQQASSSQPAQAGGPNGAPPTNQSGGNTGPLVPNDGRDVQPVTGDLGGAGLGSIFGPTARPAPGGNPSVNPPNGSNPGQGATETVTTDFNILHPDGFRVFNTSYKLVQGIKEDGTRYSYIESRHGLIRYPLREVAVMNGQSLTTMYALDKAGDTGPVPTKPTLVTVIRNAEFTTRPRNEKALTEASRNQSGGGDQQKDPPQRSQNQQGEGQGPGVGPKSAKAGALENSNNKSDSKKSDNKNTENRTERAPGGHSGKPAAAPTKLQQAVTATEAGKTDQSSNNQAHEDKFAHEPASRVGKPATASAKSQPAAKLMEFDTSHMGLASKPTETAAAKAHETPPAKFDTSHLGTSSSSTKPVSAPANKQQAGKLTAFDTSHMSMAAKLQSFAKPSSSTAAKTLATQH